MNTLEKMDSGIAITINQSIHTRAIVSHAHRWFGVIMYTIFLFLVIVVLLNLLIAQMSDTYGSVQQDAQRSLAINRALIVARVEHNSLLARVS